MILTNKKSQPKCASLKSSGATRNEKEYGGSASAYDNLKMKEYLLGLKDLSGPTIENQPSSCSSTDYLLITILMVIMMMVVNIMLALFGVYDADTDDLNRCSQSWQW